MYFDVKNNKEKYPDYMVGYIGYEMSFGAKWFGGYVKRHDEKHRGDIYSYKSCMKQAPNLRDIKFDAKSFFDMNIEQLENCVVYCDPPYRDSLGYRIADFDYEMFYERIRKMSKKNTVLVSEYSMPDDFTCIWSKEVKCLIDSNRQKQDYSNNRTEKLFIYNI